MRLATFNIWNGRSLDDGRVDPDRLAAAIRHLDPDVLGLQEVDLNQPRSHLADLAAVAADAMGATDHRFVAALDGTPGAQWVAVTGEPVAGHPLYGISLLTRFPVRTWDVLRLPSIGPHVPVPVPASGRTVLIGEEPRTALFAELDTPHGPLTVANTHLSFLPGWNVVQLRAVARRIGRHVDPAMIMGDLNLPAPLPAALTAFRSLARYRTFPANSPRLQLDHLLLRGHLGTVRRSEAVRLPVSDHRALVVEID